MTEKYREAKRIHRFREIRTLPVAGKNLHAWHELAGFTPVRYYSTANRSTSHVLADTSASEWPPAGPEKCSYTLRFDQCNQIFESLNFTKTSDFSPKIRKIPAHDRTPCCNEARPLQIHFAIWHHGSKASTPLNDGKIPRGQTNSQISRNSSLNTARVQNRYVV